MIVLQSSASALAARWSSSFSLSPVTSRCTGLSRHRLAKADAGDLKRNPAPRPLRLRGKSLRLFSLKGDSYFCGTSWGGSSRSVKPRQALSQGFAEKRLFISSCAKVPCGTKAGRATLTHRQFSIFAAHFQQVVASLLGHRGGEGCFFQASLPPKKSLVCKTNPICFFPFSLFLLNLIIFPKCSRTSNH